MSAFRHAPYAQGRAPFTIGLAPIDAEEWIAPDEDLGPQLALKARILAQEGAEAFAALPGSEAAQAETLALLAEYLTTRHPQIYARVAQALRVAPIALEVPLAGEPALLAASRLVQDDLLLLARDAEGWRLVAGSLCFPSTWKLSDKIGRPLGEIHAPVPGFAGAMQQRVERIFDNLQPGRVVERFNTSIYGDARLRHSESTQDPMARFPPAVPALARAHVRVERQSLRRLPSSGAILFTVRVHVDPLEALRLHPQGRALAMALRAELLELNAERLAYKGLTQAIGRVVAAIDGEFPA